MEVQLQRLSYTLARWVKEPEIKKLPDVHGLAVKDKGGNVFILFESEFWLKLAMERNPSLDLRPLEQCPGIP